ncbi:HK97 gp10 family phage protein, partial [Streptococcus equi]|nr:HK97 gp10 family phage protein [Streptococcus equi]
MAKVKYGNWTLVAELEDYKDEMERWVKRGIARTTMKIYNTAVTLA